ncbi:hypothetical protein HZC32_02245 [Candidatus Woesearchaeota archaeon]|nr:hypothetical protein [Candidatus Woesearchaeota archaeon]
MKKILHLLLFFQLSCGYNHLASKAYTGDLAEDKAAAQANAKAILEDVCIEHHLNGKDFYCKNRFCISYDREKEECLYEVTFDNDLSFSKIKEMALEKGIFSYYLKIIQDDTVSYLQTRNKKQAEELMNALQILGKL